jgi:hypothetical protein
MANLIINRTREVTLGTETFIKGMWKVEIVHPNGEIEKPFGDEMRPNLLMTRGLLSLAGTQVGWGSIARLMVVAQYGNDITASTDRNYKSGVINGWNTTTSDANTGIFNWSGYSSVTSNTVSTDTVNGTRVFTKVYDFLATTYQHTVREILITDYNDPGNRGAGRAYQTNSGIGTTVLSRFVLPAPVTLQQYQFLRLTYSLQVTIPAIVTPINIDVSSGSFSGLGLLKCVGGYTNIFGSMNSAGTPLDASYRYYGSSTGKPTPWCMVGQAGTSGYLMPGGDSSGSTQVAFPAVNVDFHNIGAQASSVRVGTSSAGSSITNIGYSNSNLSYTRGATLLFPATNPNISNAFIGGIFFTAIDDSGGMQAAATDYAGWYWRFVDGANNPRGQLKDINFALAVNIQHTASIT